MTFCGLLFPRIRRKKCDEARPTCTQCHSTGRKCEYASAPTPQAALTAQILQKTFRLVHFSPQNFTLPEEEVAHLEFFTNVGVNEFITFFENDIWERITLQAAFNESCIRQAALAIGAMSRARHIHKFSLQTEEEAFKYATKKYNLAIRELNKRVLEDEKKGWEIALLGAVFFVALEVYMCTKALCEIGACTTEFISAQRVAMHMRGAEGIIRKYMGGASSSGLPGSGFTDGTDLSVVAGGLFQMKLQTIALEHLHHSKYDGN
jgi:hypothetical protein